MRRVSIDLDGLVHRNPVPAASRISNILVSGLISGIDPQTGQLGASLPEQAAFMFAQMRRILAAANATTEDVVKVTVWMADRSQRDEINPFWTNMFPDRTSRPARQTMTAQLDPGKFVQCDFVAVLQDEP